MNLTSLRQGLLYRLNNRRFWRDSGLLMLANIIVLALGVIRTPAVTWILPKEQVGMMGVVASWLPFLQLLSLPGLDSSAYHYTAKGQPWAFWVNIVYRLRWSLLSVAGFLLGAAYWWWQGDIVLGWMFVVAGVSYPVTVGLSAGAGILGAQEKFVGLFWYRIFESLTDFVGFIPLVVSAWWVSQVVTFYAANQLATAVMQVIVTVWLVLQLRRTHTPPLSADEEKEVVRYGKHLTLLGGISVAQTRTDAWLIGAFLPLTVMADYSIALLVYEQFKRLWGVYVAVRYPRLVRLPLEHRRRRLLWEGAVMVIGFLGVGVVVALLSIRLIPLILPAGYTGSISYINWLIGVFVASVPGFFAEIYFRSKQDEKRQYWLRAIGAVSGVAFSLLLLYPLGAIGVLLGRLLSSLALSLTGVLLFWLDR